MNPYLFIDFQLARGNLLAAETALEEILKNSPEDSNAHANLALVKLQQGFKDGARRSVSLALKFGAGNAFAHFVQSHVRLADLRLLAIPLLGTSPENGFEVRKAIAEVQEAIRLDSHEPIYLLRLAELQALLGRWKLALAAADAALVVDPESVPAGIARADALFGWFARREKAGQSTYAEAERQLGNRQIYLVLFSVAGAVVAIVVGRFSRGLLWGSMGLVPGVYGIWIVRKIPQATARKWAWFYACMVLLAGLPVALWLEARVLRMPNWGLLLAMLGPILPLALFQEITAKRQRTAEHESAKARLRQGADFGPVEEDG